MRRSPSPNNSEFLGPLKLNTSKNHLEEQREFLRSVGQARMMKYGSS